MERFLILLTLLFSLNVMAAQPSAVPGIGAGATDTAASSNIPLFQQSDTTYPVFTVYAGSTANTTADSFYPFYYNGAPFKTGANKKAYCHDLMSLSSTTGLAFQMVTSTASITFAQSAALTAPTYTCGATTRYCLYSGATASIKSKVPGLHVFGDGSADTYVAYQASSSAQTMLLQMECYLK